MSFSGKAGVILVWGFALIVAQGFISGQLQALVTEITGGTNAGGAKSGYLPQLGGELLLVFILYFVSQTEDMAANMSLVFLAALTLLLLVTNSGQVGTWLHSMGV